MFPDHPRILGLWRARCGLVLHHVASFVCTAASVVGRVEDPRLVRTDRSLSCVLLKEEGGLVVEQEDSGRGRHYGAPMRSRLIGTAAGVLTVTGELEVLVGTTGTRAQLVSALALACMTAALACSRRAPLRR